MNPLIFRNRTQEEEVMDEFHFQGPPLKKTLKDLARVNRLLGGNRITMDGVEKILHLNPKSRQLKIVDVGCGDGMMLRELALYGRKRNWNLQLFGLDANGYAIDIARELSRDYPEISFSTRNVFSEEFETEQADIFLCTLTLHHFSEAQIKSLVGRFLKNSTMGVVINDLQRSKLAYQLFKAFCAVFVRNRIARKDGLISIRRGFQKNELWSIGCHHQATQEIKWKWAFRYQWILYKT